MFSQESFASRLKQLRLKNNLSMNDLAKALHTSKTFVSYIESGKRTTPIDKLVEIADYFDVSLDYLVGRSDDPVRR